MGIILHRMTHLLIYRYNLDTEYVSLLLGPFAIWHSVDPDIPKESAVISSTVLEVCPVVDAVRVSAANRVAELWRIVESKVDPKSEPGVLYYLGILIDTHMNLLWYPKHVTIHEVYRAGIAPDQQVVGRVCNDETYPLTTASIQWLWQEYVCPAPVPALSKVRLRPTKVGAKRTTKSAKNKASRKRKRDTSFVPLFPEHKELPSAQMEITVPQQINNFVKIIQKGLPRATTVRSIEQLLHKTVAEQPAANVAVVTMVRKFLVGAFKDATKIASPLVRVLAYAPTTKHLVLALGLLKKEHMYAMVAEYAIGMAKSVPPLHAVLRRDADWNEYCDQAHTVCNEYLRKSLCSREPVFSDAEPPRRIPVLFWTMVDVLGARSLGDDTSVGLVKTFATMSPQCQFKLCSFVGTLSDPETGESVTESDTEAVRKVIVSRKHTHKAIQKMVRGLSPHGKRVLRAYVHVLYRQSMYSDFMDNPVQINESPRITPRFERPMSTSRVFWVLMKELGLGVKRCVRKPDIVAAKTVCPNLATMYAAFRSQAESYRIYTAVLRRVGMPDVDVDTIEAAFAALEPNRIAPRFKEMIKKMSPSSVAVLKLYVHMLYQRSTFAVIPICIERDPPKDHKKILPYLLVCTTCYTIRSQVHGVNVNLKSKDGVHVDTINFSVTCTSCESPVEMVNLVHNRVVGLNVNDMDTPALVCMCRMCGKATRYRHVIGSDELCGLCFTAARERIEPKRCVCGLEFTRLNSAAKTFVALDDKGESALYAVCKRHVSILEHAIHPIHPIGFFRHLIQNTRRPSRK